MKNKVKKDGNYELFSTTNKNTILHLDKSSWYAVVKGQQGDILVKSNSDHEKKKTLQKGRFYLVSFNNDPDFQDMTHLFLKKGSKYDEWLLPDELPSTKEKNVKLIKSKHKIGESKLKDHIQNKEKAAKQGLESKNRNYLYDLAKKHDINGRSKMNKKELAKALEGKV